MNRFGWLFIALAVTTVACDKASSDTDVSEDSDRAAKKEKKKKKKKKDKTADAKPSATATATATPTAVAQECGSTKTIPTIPTGRSNPPTVAEWKTACEVNTQGANSEGQDCTSHILREWLRITCRNDITGVENFEGFGAEGLDYFKVINKPDLVSYVVRLRKGHSQKVRMCRSDQRASLFVSWPSSKEQPTIVAVGRGPKCDSH